jgi:NAD-reducing hydrogenase large subunit
VNSPLSGEQRDQILASIPEALAIAQRTLKWFKGIVEQFREEIRTFGNFPSMFLGMVTPSGPDKHDAMLDHYDGVLRFVDASGNIVADQIESTKYPDYIAEAVEPFTYLKSPYYKSIGYPEGIYRVGPLARLNIIDRPGTPLADQEWTEFRALRRGVILSSFHQHYARLVEILYGIEKIEQLLADKSILDTNVRAIAKPSRFEGIGVSEAPRGTLMHHYKIDENGLITWVNMIIATGHNNLAMNRSVKQVAQHYVKSGQLKEGMLNRVEAVIRSYDPCLSCSTHAMGQMPIQIQLISPDGTLLQEMKR